MNILVAASVCTPLIDTQLQLLSTVVGCHVKENQEISFTKVGTESGWLFFRF